MADPETLQQIVRKQFLITCLKCGSHNTVIDFEPAHNYSELTSDPATLSIGCNACKANDLREWL